MKRKNKAEQKDGVTSAADPVHEVPNPKRSKADLYKAPTNEELSQLRETENLFQSSLFRMQITELLGEVLLKEKKKRSTEDFVEKLSEVLLKIQPGIDTEITDQAWVKKAKLKVPFIQQPYKVKGRFRFLPPKAVHTVGSFPMGTAVKPETNVDLVVEIPQEVIQAKDYLNQRYLRKRALYLVALAKHLQECPLVAKMKFSRLHGNQLKPLLVIIPAGNLGKSLTIRIHTCIEEGVLKMNRFHVNKSNLRNAWFSEEKNADTEENDPPSPHYNTAVLPDLCGVGSHRTLAEAVSGHKGVQMGMALLKVWLTQRQLHKGLGCFSGYIMTAYVVYLLQQRKISNLMSSYQIMRNTLNCLASTDWIKSPPSLATESTAGQPSLEEFQQHFDVIFVDPSGYINLCADMTTAVYKMVKHEAQLAISFLEIPGFNSFDTLFMKPVNFFAKYDQTLQISGLSTNLVDCVEKLDCDWTSRDRGGDQQAAIIPKLLKLIDKAAGRRIKAMAIKSPGKDIQWDITKEPPSSLSTGAVMIGFIADPDTCNSVVDKGPAADSPEAKEFREFWGERSELRRFQDTSICEAVVWKGDTMAAKRTVLGKIIRYVLHKHAGLPRNSLQSIGSQLDSVLQPTVGGGGEERSYGTGEEQHQAVLRSYDDLCKHLRGLSNLPLVINTIQGLSAVFRYTEVFPGAAAGGGSEGQIQDEVTPSWQQPHHVLCLLEASGKWPDEVAAVERIKAAFRLQLARELNKSCKLQTTVRHGCVDVLQSGHVFRLELGYVREVTLRRMVTTVDGLVKMMDTDAATALEERIVTLPKLSSTLHGLHQQHPSYGAAVRLAKRWLRSQLLCSLYVRDEAIELIMAAVYLHAAPYTTPSCPLTGFVRFLQLVATFDWKNSPLIVNLNNKLTKADFASILTTFERDRSVLPWLFIATPDDQHKSRWTHGSRPSAPVLLRMVLLARQASQQLESMLDNTSATTDYKAIFRPPLDCFDLVLQLDMEHLPRTCQAVDAVEGAECWQVEENEEEDVMPAVNFDPVQCYLKELRDSYDEHALFFHNPYGGQYIAVLWKPHTQQSRDFKVSHLNASKPDTSDDSNKPHLVFHKEAAIEDFRILGEGLITSVSEPEK